MTHSHKYFINFSSFFQYKKDSCLLLLRFQFFRFFTFFFCKYSQFRRLTECSRQHIFPTTSMTTLRQDSTNHKGLALCLDATLGIKAHRWVPVNTRGTPMPQRRKAVGSPEAPQTTTTRQQDSNTFVEHLHGCGAGSLRPQIYEATTVLPRSRRVQEPTVQSRRRSRKRFRRRTRRSVHTLTCCTHIFLHKARAQSHLHTSHACHIHAWLKFMKKVFVA